MIRPEAALAASIAALTLSTPAQAGEAAPRQIAVQYGDLDLTHESGANVLLMRLERAAATLCGARNVSFRDFRAARQARACKEATLSDAVARVEAPLVQTIYAERRGQRTIVAEQK